MTGASELNCLDRTWFGSNYGQADTWIDNWISQLFGGIQKCRYVGGIVGINYLPVKSPTRTIVKDMQHGA